MRRAGRGPKGSVTHGNRFATDTATSRQGSADDPARRAFLRGGAIFGIAYSAPLSRPPRGLRGRGLSRGHDQLNEDPAPVDHVSLLSQSLHLCEPVLPDSVANVGDAPRRDAKGRAPGIIPEKGFVCSNPAAATGPKLTVLSTRAFTWSRLGSVDRHGGTLIRAPAVGVNLETVGIKDTAATFMRASSPLTSGELLPPR
ncbi:hypothetical protein HPB50_020182 [Hyalomma asiaticum]|uniref:Uncharacterized protein n=1 Tax=Hyalomma asiaticum TaxID=266040 RepID=A0ACB7TL28_HYAAI|nr:hypothetical protein HPB50_020182 [Hyalomma asiaticum]